MFVLQSYTLYYIVLYVLGPEAMPKILRISSSLFRITTQNLQTVKLKKPLNISLPWVSIYISSQKLIEHFLLLSYLLSDRYSISIWRVVNASRAAGSAGAPPPSLRHAYHFLFLTSPTPPFTTTLRRAAVSSCSTSGGLTLFAGGDFPRPPSQQDRLDL